MKFCKLKQIGIGTLSLAMGLFFSCSPFAAAEDGGIVPLSSVSENEPNNSASTATNINSLTDRDAVIGFISSSSDVDFYKFTTTSSQSGKMKLIFNNPSSNYNYGITIYKSSVSTSNMCAEIKAAGDKTVLLSVSPNTTYYIKIDSANSKYTAITPYIFTLRHYSSNENVYGTLGWAYPLPSNYTTISTRFGDPGYTSDKKPHSGIDLPVDEKDEGKVAIYNTADGVVKRASENSTMGNFVIINTTCYEPNDKSLSGSLTVRYLHMNEYPSFSSEQAVSKGTILGKVGDSGLSYGAHLHIDINNMETTDGPTMRNNPTHLIDPVLFYPRINFTGLASESLTTEEFLYENDFYSIDTVISNQVDQDEYKLFGEMYRGTADFNIVNFVKHFNYPKELFASIVEQYNLEWYDADVIYSDDEALIAEFFGLDN